MRSWFFFILLFLCFSVNGQAPFSVYLIGDAGEDPVPGKALRMLEEQIRSDSNSAVIFLGDNAYPNGLKKKDPESEANLNSQLQILKGYKGQAYFIPGNHDWNAQKRDGVEVLKDQQVYVNEYISKNTSVKNPVAFLPADGLPGPVSVMLSEDLRLILIDTQWFLHLFRKNYSGSKKETADKFFYRLDSLLNRAKENNEKVIIAGHHPMYTNGAHSKTKQPLRFLVNYTPFQLFGLMGLNRLYSQDLAQPKYRKFRERLLRSIDAYDDIVYVCGHEHNLQCFYEKKNRFIVSGSGSKLTKLHRKKRFREVFADDKHIGFFRLTAAEGKKFRITVFREDLPPQDLDF
jgi:hypothetical protein